MLALFMAVLWTRLAASGADEGVVRFQREIGPATQRLRATIGGARVVYTATSTFHADGGKTGSRRFEVLLKGDKTAWFTRGIGAEHRFNKGGGVYTPNHFFLLRRQNEDQRWSLSHFGTAVEDPRRHRIVSHEPGLDVWPIVRALFDPGQPLSLADLCANPALEILRPAWIPQADRQLFQFSFLCPRFDNRFPGAQLEEGTARLDPAMDWAIVDFEGVRRGGARAGMEMGDLFLHRMKLSTVPRRLENGWVVPKQVSLVEHRILSATDRNQTKLMFEIHADIESWVPEDIPDKVFEPSYYGVPNDLVEPERVFPKAADPTSYYFLWVIFFGLALVVLLWLRHRQQNRD